MSARANALTLESSVTEEALLRALNGVSSDVFFAAASVVPPNFRVRRALSRHYVYFEIGDQARLSAWQRAARLFQGPVDVRSFGRGFPRDRPASRAVDEVSVGEVDGGIRIDVRAPSFVWGMVRKIVASLRAVDRGELDLPTLQEAIDGHRVLTLPLAEPENLVLWDVEFGIPWEVLSPRRSRRQVQFLEEERDRAERRRRLLSVFEAPG